MKIALVQMSMGKEICENLDKSLKYCDMAENCDLVFFPEIQLTPFFPQYHDMCVDHYCIDMDHDALAGLCQKAKKHHYYLSPMSIWNQKDPDTILPYGSHRREKSRTLRKMVHIAQKRKIFYEQDYYTPAEDGFKVFDTPFGKVGIVICFDRHMPESNPLLCIKKAQT